MSDQIEPKARARFPDLMLADLLSELLWPGLFRAAALALRPQRLLLAAATIVLVGIIGSLSRLWSEASFGQHAGKTLAEAASGLGIALDSYSFSRFWDLPLARLWQAIEALVLHAPVQIVRAFPVSAFVLGLPMLGVALLGWLAIARSAAFEFGLHAVEPWSACVARGIERLPGLALSVFAVPIAVMMLAGLTAGLSWVLLGLPGVNIVGAVLWGLSLFACVFAALLLAAWALGLPLLAPAVACDGPDAFDAMQRALAYVIGRPLRFVIYAAVLMAIGAVSAGLVSLILRGGDELATRSASALLSAEQARIFVPGGAQRSALEGTDALAAGIIDFWRSLLALAGGAFVFSFFSSASSVLYLLMRKLNDGQDIGDLASEIDTVGLSSAEQGRPD
ncbi:MAG: hypothetical protein Kow0022_10060 [Phycisphaerales bacterium]